MTWGNMLNFMKYTLAQNAGLDPRRFSAVGYGEYRPIATNDTEAGRQQNRRVEILIARNYQFNPDEGGEKGSSLASSPTGTLPLVDTPPASIDPTKEHATPGTRPGEAPVPVLSDVPTPVQPPSDPLQTK